MAEIAMPRTVTSDMDMQTIHDLFADVISGGKSSEQSWDALKDEASRSPEVLDTIVSLMWKTYMGNEAYKNQALVYPVREMRYAIELYFAHRIEETSKPDGGPIVVNVISGNELDLFGYPEVGLKGLMNMMAEETGKSFEVRITYYIDIEREKLVDQLASSGFEQDGDRSSASWSKNNVEVSLVKYDLNDQVHEALKGADIFVATLVTMYLPRARQEAVLREWMDPSEDTYVLLANATGAGTSYVLRTNLKKKGVPFNVQDQGRLEKFVDKHVADSVRHQSWEQYDIEQARTGLRGVLVKFFMLRMMLHLTKWKEPIGNVSRMLAYTNKVVEPLSKIGELLRGMGEHYYWRSDFVMDLMKDYKIISGAVSPDPYDCAFPWFALELRKK